MIYKVLGMLSVMSLSVQGNEAILNNPALKNPEAFLQKFEDIIIKKYTLEQELEESNENMRKIDAEIEKERREKAALRKALDEKEQIISKLQQQLTALNS